MLKLAK
jgi:hypothetical protein